MRYHQRKQKNEGWSETAPAPPDGDKSSQTLPQLFYVIGPNSWREGRTGSYWETARGEQGGRKIRTLAKEEKRGHTHHKSIQKFEESSFQDVLLMIFKCCLETTIPPFLLPLLWNIYPSVSNTLNVH